MSDSRNDKIMPLMGHLREEDLIARFSDTVVAFLMPALPGES